MRLKVLNKSCNLWMLLILSSLCGNVLPENPYKSGEVRADPKGCTYLRCKRGDQCVNRKFWCKNPPCPNMLYCAKSRMESLKGPSSCESVRCSRGFVCLLRVRHCRWGEPCQQRVARCVSEREYYDGPASCVDFKCPSGLRCILRESLCAKPPCKLVKSCASTEDVTSWHEGCKSLGCLSEHECFLRRPTRNCRVYPCKHTPDCSAKSEEELEAKEQCRGWVCPKGEECSALSREPCKRDSCKTSRSCQRPLMLSINVQSAPKHSWRDDVKLSFYSKVDDNSSTSKVHRPNSNLSWGNKISQGPVAEDKEIETNSTIGKSHEFPIHEAPNYGPPNSRPATSRTWSASTDTISGGVAQSTVTSLSTWLNHLKLKTGVDAIEAWIEKAEKQENYGEFLEWLESVKDMLGSDAYNLWIEEVRAMTVTSPVFQRWLPPTSTSIVPRPSVLPDSVESDRITSEENYGGLGVSPEPIDHRNSEDNSYPHQGMIKNELPNSSAMKNDDGNEESHKFPPKNNAILTKPEITIKTPVINFLEIPTLPTAVPEMGWQQFNDRDPRLFEQAYPVHHSFGNVLWANHALLGLNALDPLKLQQPPDIDPSFFNSGILRSQFSPAMNPQLNQEFMDRRLLESSEIPDQRIQTNWSFQQSPNADLNSLPPNSFRDPFFVPINPQRNQFYVDPKFLVSGGELDQQFQSGWPFPDGNPYFPLPYTWQSQLGPSFNSRQQDSIDEKFLEPEYPEYPHHRLQSNWPFQPSLHINPNFFESPNWQETLFSPPNSEWSQEPDRSRLFNQRNLESVKLSQSEHETYKPYPNNSTKENTSWMKDFLDEISQTYGTSENIGTFPTNGAKFGYGSWPGSSYRGRSLVNVPHLRTSPEDAARVDVQFHYDGRDAGRSRETLPELFEAPRPYPQFPWLLDPRLYLHLRDRDSRNFYDKNNRESPSVLSTLSRTHRVDADARSPLPKSLVVNSQRDAPRLKYHWPNIYLPNGPYGMAEPRPLPLPLTPEHLVTKIREYEEHPDELSKINRPEVIGDRIIDFVHGDQEFNSPGQLIPVLDLWNSRFRTPLSSVLEKFDKKRLGYGNAAEKKRPISTTMAPPLVSTSSVAPQKVITITDEYSKGVEVENYPENIGDAENYDDAGIYPLLLSLQGYIETSKEDEAENTALSSRNSTILPVYKVEDASDEEEDYENYYEASPDCAMDTPSNSDDQVIKLCQDANSGGVVDFPNNLNNVFDVEAAMVMKNTTDEGNVKIKNIKWDYENDVEDVEDPARFFAQSQGSFTSSNGPENDKEARGWDKISSVPREEDNTENDSYDDVVDYEDKAIPEDRSNYNSEPVNTGESLDHEEVLEELIDSLYADPDHKTFKKNRP